MATATNPLTSHLARSEWLQKATNEANRDGAREIVVDMSSVQRISSGDLNDLMKVHLRLQEQQRKLVLVNALDPLIEVFAITRIDRVIEIRETADA